MLLASIAGRARIFALGEGSFAEGANVHRA